MNICGKQSKRITSPKNNGSKIEQHSVFWIVNMIT